MVKRVVNIIWFMSLLGIWSGEAMAAACLSNVAAGVWSAPGSWTACGGATPGVADTATIQNGHVISLDAAASPRSVVGIIVNSGGTLNLGSAAANISLTVGASGITTIGTGIFRSNPAFAATHTLTIAGNISNAGTFTLKPNATSLTNTIFNNNGNQTVSGAGAYTFNLITLNMGATNANILDMQSAMVVPSPFLTITNGTYKHDNATNITPWAADPAIPASGGFWLNSAATVTTTGINVSVTGLLHISAGTMTVVGNVPLPAPQLLLNNASTFLMDGGVLTVAGGLDSAAVGSTGTFTMSAGSINVQTAGNGAVTSFMLGSGTTLNWSGGTITLVNGDNTTNDLELRSGTVNVSGGTLQIGSAATAGANQFLILNGTGASFTVWNLTLATGAVYTTSLGNNVFVLNNLTINANNTLAGVAFAINVGDATGNAIPGIGNWTNNGAYTGTGTVSFVGPGAATIGGAVATTFQNLTMNKSAAANTVTISKSTTVSSTLTFTSGQIVTGANAVIVAAAGTIATPSASSYVVGNFQKMYAAGNLSYFAGNNFPVGDATHFTPVNISAGTTTTAGSLTVSTTATEHPQVTVPIASTGINATYDIARYWTFTTATLTVGTAITSTFTFVAGDVDAGANTANFIVERYDGAVWNITTLVAANPLNTQATFTPNTLPVTGSNDFAVGDPVAGFGGIIGAYEAFETSTTAPNFKGVIMTKVAGTAFGVDIVRVNATKNGVLAGAITVEVRLLDSSSGGPYDVNNCNAAWPLIQAAPSFAIPASGRGTIPTVTVANSYPNVRFQIRSPVLGPYTAIGCSTDNFAIRPSSFTSVTVTDLDWQTAGTTRALANTGASGGNVHKAGRPFTVQATAVNAVAIPATTLNYVGTPVAVDCVYATPSTNTCNSGGLLPAVPFISACNGTACIGTPNNITLGAAVAGVINLPTTYSEVGAFTLQLQDKTFAAVDSAGGPVGLGDGTPADCTATGSYVCSVPMSVGRFVPDHFDVTALVSPTFETFGTTDASCSAGAAPRRTFTYIGQPFGYSITPQATILPRNFANATTANYTGALWKIGGTLPAGTTSSSCITDTCTFTTSWTELNGNSSNVVESYTYTLTPVSTPHWDSAGATAAAASITVGTGPIGSGGNGIPVGTEAITYASSDTLAFLRSTATPQAKFTASITDTISVADTSEAASSGNITTTTPAALGGTFDSGNEFRYGRLKLSNGFGSELLNLPIPIQAQYWDATIPAFVSNPTILAFGDTGVDNCTTLIAANVTLGSEQGGITLANMDTPAGSHISLGGAFIAGSGNLVLTKPSPTPTLKGSVVVTANLASLLYLQGAWTGATYNQNPTALAIFGAYKGAKEFIYLRENY